MPKYDLTQSLVRELLRYYPTSGRLVWRRRSPSDFTCERTWFWKTWNTKHAGMDAGSINALGYRVINLMGCMHSAHRIAWLYVHGEFPKELDHINGDCADNRLSNLREVTHRENGRNSKLPSDNTSGEIGVDWHKQTKKWRVRINHVHLGLFSDFDAAVRVRKSAERGNGFHRNHGRNTHG